MVKKNMLVPEPCKALHEHADENTSLQEREKKADEICGLYGLRAAAEFMAYDRNAVLASYEPGGIHYQPHVNSLLQKEMEDLEVPCT